jgi:hypothetical protein
MSHHLDTPLAAQSGQLFIDDLYVFPGDGSTVFVMDVNSDVTGHHAEPGFHPEARYEFKVRFDGADYEELTYRVSFGPADAAGRQPLELHAVGGEQAWEDSEPGDLVLAVRTGETAAANGIRLWAGKISDSFYIDLSLLAIVNGAVAKGTAPDLDAWHPDNAQNSFAGTTVGRSCLRSRTPTHCCAPAPEQACGAPPSSPPTPAAGGRSTGRATR